MRPNQITLHASADIAALQRGGPEEGIEIETYTYKLDEVDRAVLDGQEEGFARLHVM
jgi:hypothetical protein